MAGGGAPDRVHRDQRRVHPPDVRGRGIGAYLTQAVAQEIEARGEVAFLHAADTNVGAIRLYERLGFTLRCRPAFRRFAVPAEAPAASVSP